MEPLKGIRIVEVTTNASGPLASGLLADQGADVIRLETLGSGDPSRHVGGVRGGFTGYNLYLNRNKRSVAVDLKNPAIRPALEALIKTADVFVQNSRPGALDRHGYGYADLHKINPKLIYVSISGYGADGPGSENRVYDPVIQAVSGFAINQVDADGNPQLVKTIVSDKIAAYTAAQAISSALFARERGQLQGHHLEVSMLNASLSFLWADVFWNDSFVGEEGVQRKPLLADFYRIIKSGDGFITCIVVGDEEFKGACRALECESLLDDERFTTLSGRFANYGPLLEEFEKSALHYPSDALIARLDADGVPCAKVNSRAQVFTDPRVVHGGCIIEYEHPAAGRLRQARPPVIVEGKAAREPTPAPALGQHTDEVLLSVGCSAAEIATWRAAGVIG